jgi:hypothetical protein
MVQPTALTFSSEELMEMVERCGLNTLLRYSAHLSTHLRQARQDPKLLSLLRGLCDVIYGGSPLPREDEAWAYRSGIKLRVSLAFRTFFRNSTFVSPSVEPFRQY